MDLDKLIKIHIESWNELKKELDLGTPFWIDFGSNPIPLPNGKSINVEEMYGIIHFPMREVACSRVLVDLDNLRKGYIVAYCVDTLIPSEVLKNYTEKVLELV